MLSGVEKGEEKSTRVLLKDEVGDEKEEEKKASCQ